MKVTNEVKIYEEHGQEVTRLDHPKLLVCSHAFLRDRVCLVYGALSVTVLRSELDAALANATNTGRLF